MANAIEQKVDVSGAVGDLRLTVEQRPDPPDGKSCIPRIPFHRTWPSTGACSRSANRYSSKLWIAKPRIAVLDSQTMHE
jgi:hypothetical protein